MSHDCPTRNCIALEDATWGLQIFSSLTEPTQQDPSSRKNEDLEEP